MKEKAKRRQLIGDILVNGSLLLLVVIWTIPTFGVLVSSFRTRFDVITTGWWTIFPHREWQATEVIEPSKDLDRSGPMEIGGVTATFEEFREGIDAGA